MKGKIIRCFGRVEFELLRNKAMELIGFPQNGTTQNECSGPSFRVVVVKLANLPGPWARPALPISVPSLKPEIAFAE